jgi:Protein of unknown function (DUF3040)
MDEQRILDEMERMLAADDPKLAARLAAFGQPGFGHVLRTRRARATMSVMVLVLIAAVAAVIYMMSAFRPSGAPGRHPGRSTVSAPAAQLGRPVTHGTFCAATFCGPAFTPAVDRFLARASRQASRQ